MIRRLEDRLRKKKLIKMKRAAKIASILIGTTSIGGCFEQCTPIPPNYVPEAELSVAPVSVETSKDVYIDLDGTDANGHSDITNYEIDIDRGNNGTIEEIITQSSPISATRTFNNAEIVKITGKVTDSGGLTDSKSTNVTVYTPPVEDYLDVEGYLKILDTESPGSGEIKIFDFANPTILIAQTESDPSTGYFSFHSTTKKISDLSGIVIETAAKEGGTWKSFLVRENFPAGDVIISEPIKVKLFPSYCTPDEFKTFMNQTDMSAYGLTRFDLGNAEGIEILLKNCDSNKNWDTSGDPNIGWQYLTDPQNLKTKELNGLANHFDGTIVGDSLYLSVNGQQKIIPIIIESSPNSQDHYTVESNLIFPEVGWITFAPDKGLGGGRTNFFWDFDYSRVLLKRARIDLGVVNDVISLHESLHVFQGANPDYNGHCDILPFYNEDWQENILTIMIPDRIGITSSGPADIDARKIVYNYAYSPGKDIEDILGQTFSDGESVY
jgi:hypothetical protein